MYEKLIDEGHDGRLFRFSPSADGTIKGSHKDVQNVEYWVLGCLGVTEQCSATCEAAFLECVESGDTSTAKNRTKTFAQCMDEKKFVSLGCPADCSPTFDMLAASEMPTEYVFDNFGAGSGVAQDQPATSLCEIE